MNKKRQRESENEWHPRIIARGLPLVVLMTLSASPNVLGEVRKVTVTTDKELRYLGRTYACQAPGGGPITEVDVSAQLGPGGWTVGPGGGMRNFTVDCPPGTHVVGFKSVVAWTNIPPGCLSLIGNGRLPAGTPLGSVTTALPCQKGGGRGDCFIHTCGEDGFVEGCNDPLDCAAPDCDPGSVILPGIDYEVEGDEFDELASSGEIPTVSEWGLVAMVLLALTAGTMVFSMRGTRAAA